VAGAKDLNADLSAPAEGAEPRRSAWRRLGSAIRLTAFAAAIGSIAATFLLVTGLVSIQLTERWAIGLVFGTAAVAVILAGVVTFDLMRLFREFWRGEAGARLHLRIVGLFTLIAAVPAILVAIIASVTLERGLNPWFSGALRDLVTSSGTIAQGYQQQVCQNIGREMRLMAEDIDRARRVGLYEQDRGVFRNFVTTRAIMLGFPYAVIVRPDGTVLERAETRSVEQPQSPTEQDFADAATAEPPCILTERHVGALIRIPAFEDAYLHVARMADQQAVAFGRVATEAVQQYRILDAQRENVQRAFAIMYAIITLMLLLSAIWLGIAFADRLVAPIRRLITATDAVSAGNLYVQVPTHRSEGDIGHLGRTFNNMIAEIRQQQNRLLSASEALDQRRQFTEAVLSGVSVGVVGVDDGGRIAIANPVAEGILGVGLPGRLLADVSADIDSVFQEARRSRTGSLQRQINLVAGGRERTLFVRASSEKATTERRGFIVTIDDITDLVSAQRTSAWADVARRIAHEIKNPLTPIQLSAERIRRKYGRAITEDRAVFDQCTDTIIRQVEDIRRMVDEFSSFARMPKPQPERDDIVETLRQTLFLMRGPAADARACRLRQKARRTGRPERAEERRRRHRRAPDRSAGRGPHRPAPVGDRRPPPGDRHRRQRHRISGGQPAAAAGALHDDPRGRNRPRTPDRREDLRGARRRHRAPRCAGRRSDGAPDAGGGRPGGRPGRGGCAGNRR
jgi:two-component system, NtrC family, nitrogen regulation sensor histidine kinase NtrY